MSGEGCSGCAVAVLEDSKERKVGKLGVDLDWKPLGTALWASPLLCGGMTDREEVRLALAIGLFFNSSSEWSRGFSVPPRSFPSMARVVIP